MDFPRQARPSLARVYNDGGALGVARAIRYRGDRGYGFQSVPVIGCDLGGISDWLKHEENGFLVRSGDEGALAEKINFLLDHPDIASLMGKRGRDMVKDRFRLRGPHKRLFEYFKSAE